MLRRHLVESKVMNLARRVNRYLNIEIFTPLYIDHANPRVRVTIRLISFSSLKRAGQPNGRPS